MCLSIVLTTTTATTTTTTSPDIWQLQYPEQCRTCDPNPTLPKPWPELLWPLNFPTLMNSIITPSSIWNGVSHVCRFVEFGASVRMLHIFCCLSNKLEYHPFFQCHDEDHPQINLTLTHHPIVMMVVIAIAFIAIYTLLLLQVPLLQLIPPLLASPPQPVNLQGQATTCSSILITGTTNPCPIRHSHYHPTNTTTTRDTYGGA